MLALEASISVGFISQTRLYRPKPFSCSPLPLSISYSSLQILHFSTHLPYVQRTGSLQPNADIKSNSALASKLLNFQCKSGRMEDAQKLFDEMFEKNIVSWTMMIYGYARNGFHHKSLQLFSQMQISGLAPNSFTMVGILVSAAGFQSSKLVASVHGQNVKAGLDIDSFVRTATLDSYAKCGDVVESRKLFEEMVNPNLIACNAMISGFVRNEFCKEAFLLFKQFSWLGLTPNAVTLLSVTRACTAFASLSLCQCAHGYVVKLGLDLNISVNNSVLDMYLSLDNLEIGNYYFAKMDCKDVISWTTMMGFLLRLESASDALRLFQQMMHDGINPDMVAAINVITACGLLGDLMRGKSIHNWVIASGYGVNIPVVNSLIAMYSKCGDLDSARTTFNQLTEKSLVSWTAMITGYVQNGQPREAVTLLFTMRKGKGFKLDSAILVNILSACGELVSLDMCMQFHACIFKTGFLSYNSVQNSLVATYSRCGNVELAYMVFKEMDYHGIVAWNAIIYGYGINGQGKVAVALFCEMEKCEVPDSVTYLSVLNACSHSGLVDDGLVIFKQMLEEKKIRPRAEHLGCIVDMLARAGRLVDVREFVDSTVSCKVSLNVWRALLGGCRIHNDVKLAELAADQVFQLDPKDSGQLVLLSNLYASFGRFEEAEKLRSDMRIKGLTKNPGLSLLNVSSSDNS